MTSDANRKRHQALLERDWKSESVVPMQEIQEDPFLNVRKPHGGSVPLKFADAGSGHTQGIF